MELSNRMKLFTMVNREMQEFRTSLVWTPIATAAGLTLLMLISVVLAGRFAMLGDDVIHIFTGESEGGTVNLELSVGEDPDTGEEDLLLKKIEDEEAAEPTQSLTITENPEDVAEDAWNFSGEWTFSAPRREKRSQGGLEYDSINPLFNGLHSIFLLILFFVSINFLLSSLYDDRKDRSILFWKSMPVSEWEEVASKLLAITIVAPVLFFAVSLLTQVLFMLLGMLMVWRMDGSPGEFIGELQFAALVGNQMGGLLVWMLWSLPVYGWLMLCSAAAKRSPFLLAIAIPLGLVIGERILFGTRYVLYTIGNHLPRLVDGDDASSLGFYAYGPVWSGLDYMGMVLGVATAALFLAGAVWLRRHRFEI